MAQRVRAVVIGVLGCVTLWHTVGCLPSAMPKEFAQVAEQMVSQVRDQGVLDDFKSNLDANVQNPGLESYVKIVTAMGIRLVGVNGEVDLATRGAGTKLPRGLRESLISQLDGPISDEQRNGILQILGWNRQQEGPD